MQRLARNEAATATGNSDMISKLPNDLLLNILERVDTLDAIRTCILSKRMLKLPAMFSRFDIDIASIARHTDESCGFTLRDVVRINGAVAHVTENIMFGRSGDITIRKLRVRFILRGYDCLSIGTSVGRAMATNKVEAAEFEILTEKVHEGCMPADLLNFATQFNTFLGASPDAFAGLTRLRLRNMRFGESGIPNILSTCKCLKSLHLTYCDSGINSVLQVEHDQLVEFFIDYGHFQKVELVCLPKLERVSYNNWVSCEDPLSFGFVPRLSKLSLTKAGTRSHKTLELSQLLADVPSITEMHLDFESEKIWVLPECPTLLAPVLGKLQFVNLDNLREGCDIAWTMFILEAAPSVKELCIAVRDHWCTIVMDKKLRQEYGYLDKSNVEWKPSASNFKHKNLAKLTIYGFQPEDSFMRYISRVMEAAVNLEEISLHDRKSCDGYCAGDLDPKIKVCPSRYPGTPEERMRVTEELGMASSCVVHFRS
ncbi:hypothetical protein QYE76_017907 [Lolium multiflorum]|uniref:F-box domain-containing protein n=1 Tax=Lolium multiflorum TaxID=4521 RepID=A0AAD8QJ92_LOLMU|nr:hypothetical protein QYE76_017907 [Lolium multiflorum]